MRRIVVIKRKKKRALQIMVVALAAALVVILCLIGDIYKSDAAENIVQITLEPASSSGKVNTPTQSTEPDKNASEPT